MYYVLRLLTLNPTLTLYALHTCTFTCTHKVSPPCCSTSRDRTLTTMPVLHSCSTATSLGLQVRHSSLGYVLKCELHHCDQNKLVSKTQQTDAGKCIDSQVTTLLCRLAQLGWVGVEQQCECPPASSQDGQARACLATCLH